jgi:type II secretory pathway component PulJ
LHLWQQQQQRSDRLQQQEQALENNLKLLDHRLQQKHDSRGGSGGHNGSEQRFASQSESQYATGRVRSVGYDERRYGYDTQSEHGYEAGRYERGQYDLQRQHDLQEPEPSETLDQPRARQPFDTQQCNAQQEPYETQDLPYETQQQPYETQGELQYDSQSEAPVSARPSPIDFEGGYEVYNSMEEPLATIYSDDQERVSSAEGTAASVESTAKGTAEGTAEGTADQGLLPHRPSYDRGPSPDAPHPFRSMTRIGGRLNKLRSARKRTRDTTLRDGGT